MEPIDPRFESVQPNPAPETPAPPPASAAPVPGASIPLDAPVQQQAGGTPAHGANTPASGSGLRDPLAPMSPPPEAAADQLSADLDAELPGVAQLDDATANEEPNPILVQTSISPRHKVEAWMAEMVRLQASDLILRAGGKPSCRIDGRIHFLPGRVPPPGALLEVLEGVIGVSRMDIWRERGSVDTALQLDGLGRFRLNAYKQMGEPAIVLRRISGEPPLLSSLCLPTVQLERLALRKRGLVLVTGIAGSGKSTTLAAMVQYMNTHAERHIITLEDPVETLFKEDRCVISQREIGTDCDNFSDGLRHALRQSPDAILIGEMRDAETVGSALDATETGHLVMSTLHTVNAAQTVDRILSFFPSESHQQIRQRLAENLAAVLSLRLVPRKTGKGMVPAVELLLSTPRIRELLYEGKVNELSKIVEAGTDEGLVSFNFSLKNLIQHDLVELEVALAASDRPEELLLALRGYSKGQGIQSASPTQESSHLRLASSGE